MSNKTQFLKELLFDDMCLDEPGDLKWFVTNYHLNFDTRNPRPLVDVRDEYIRLQWRINHFRIDLNVRMATKIGAYEQSRCWSGEGNVGVDSYDTRIDLLGNDGWTKLNELLVDVLKNCY